MKLEEYIVRIVRAKALNDYVGTYWAVSPVKALTIASKDTYFRSIPKKRGILYVQAEKV